MPPTKKSSYAYKNTIIYRRYDRKNKKIYFTVRGLDDDFPSLASAKRAWTAYLRSRGKK
jgi:hypothetical protein